MRRRQFIAWLGGGAVALAQVAPAQEQNRVRRIGLLMASAESDPDGQSRAKAFRDRLQELGWTGGRNLQLDWRWAAGDPERFRTYAAELVAVTPDVLLADATPSASALLRETRAIPIVFCRVGDAVGSGFVESLARPGGNVTGFTAFETPIGLGVWPHPPDPRNISADEHAYEPVPHDDRPNRCPASLATAIDLAVALIACSVGL